MTWKKRFILSVAAVFLMALPPVRASEDVRFSIEYLTAASGLPSNSIRCIHQDSNGFIWAGTVNSGLFRCDGKNVRKIYPDYTVGVTLADPRIKSIAEDGNGYLWISTMSDQISCYSLMTETFVDYTGTGDPYASYRMLSFAGDDVWLWGRGQGCMRVMRENGIFYSEKLSVDSNDLPSDNVNFILPDRDSSIWIGTELGLCRYDESGSVWYQEDYSFLFGAWVGNQPAFLSSDGRIWTIRNARLVEIARIGGVSSTSLWTGEFVTSDGRWVLYSASSSYIWNPVDGQVRKLPESDIVRGGRTIIDDNGNVLIFNDHGQVSYYDSGMNRFFSMDSVSETGRNFGTTRYGFVRSDNGMVWISTHGNGLWTLDVHDGRTRHYSMGDRYSDIIMCILEDRACNIWLGTEYSGLVRLTPSDTVAEYIHFGRGEDSGYADMVRMVDVSPNEGVWLCTRDGRVHMYSRNLSDRLGTMSFPDAVYSMCEDTAGVRWIGTRGSGLYAGDKRLVHDRKNPESLSSDNVFSIVRDDSGRMWIATFGGGLNLAVRDASGDVHFRKFFTDGYGRRRTRAVIEDRKGMIWLATSDGLLVFDPDSLVSDPSAYRVFNSHNGLLHSDEVRAVKEDSRGRIWIAETGQGFCICERKDTSFAFRHYSTDDGLVNSQVQGFVEDRDANMWITTEYGVSCMDIESGRFRNFVLSNDIQSNTCLDNCTAVLDDGRLVFGTNAGLAIVEPDVVLSHDDKVRPVVFTGFKVDGVEVEPSSEDSPMPVSVTYSPDIVLSYDRNSFSVSYSTLDFLPGIRYSSKLEGYDRDWSIPSEQDFVTYRDLPPGKYTLSVRSIDAAGKWSEDAASLNIRVKPPFYDSAVAWILYVSVVLALLWLSFRVLKKMNALRNAAEVERQVTEYKLVFFTNVSHEFRTPLTLILNSLDRLKSLPSLRPETERTIRTMETGTQRLLRLVNQLIEFRKLQTGKFQLKIQKTEVIGFLRSIYDTFEGSAQDKKIDCSFTSNVASAEVYIDRGDVDKIVYNLISNALKYTPSGGRVNFSVEVDDSGKKLMLKVSDNGIGVPVEKRGQLFTRFMSDAGSESSMGIGLNLTKSLVQADKGDIWYEENPGGGSVFTVVLPTDPSLFGPEDIVSNDDSSSLPVSSGSIVEPGPVGRTPAGNFGKNTHTARPLNRQKVLVIEDDNDIRRLIVEELSPYFIVKDAAEGQSGMKCLEEEKDIELVVCDVLMPGISGYEVTRKIKDNFETCHIPVILLTALSAEEKQMEGFNSGADAYITKPFRPDYVLMRIRNLLEQRNRLREKFSNDLSLKADAICTNERDKEFMDKISSVLEKQLANPDFSMDDFASEMNMGRSSFYSKIHSLTGYSPNKYIRILRLKKAAELLMTGEYNSSEVAFMVGIQDPSYFSKSFKEQFGMTPKAYQKQAADSKKPEEAAG